MKSRKHIKLEHTKSSQLNSIKSFSYLLLFLSASLINGCAVCNYTTTKSDAFAPEFEKNVKFYVFNGSKSNYSGDVPLQLESLKSLNTAVQELRVEKIKKDLIEISPVLFSENEDAIPINIQIDYSLTDYNWVAIVIGVGTVMIAPMIFPWPLPWVENNFDVTVEIEDRFTGLYKINKYSFKCSYIQWMSFSPVALLFKKSENSITAKFNQYYSRNLSENNLYIPLYELTRKSIANCVLESINSCNKADILRAYTLRKTMMDYSK